MVGLPRLMAQRTVLVIQPLFAQVQLLLKLVLTPVPMVGRQVAMEHNPACVTLRLTVPRFVHTAELRRLTV